jgi:hypothetical protein
VWHTVAIYKDVAGSHLSDRVFHFLTGQGKGEISVCGIARAHAGRGNLKDLSVPTLSQSLFVLQEPKAASSKPHSQEYEDAIEQKHITLGNEVPHAFDESFLRRWNIQIFEFGERIIRLGKPTLELVKETDVLFLPITP